MHGWHLVHHTPPLDAHTHTLLHTLPPCHTLCVQALNGLPCHHTPLLPPHTEAAATPTTARGAGAGSVLPVRRILFKHVRVNRFFSRLTYEGPPVSINNFGLVLDSRVYRDLKGGWRTVLNRCVLAVTLCLGKLL